MTRNFLILDTDGGVDDAEALLMLIAHGRSPDAITTVFGNVGLAEATRNIGATLSIAGADIPVHRGADRPLVQPIVDARHIHGDDGLGGALPASLARPSGEDAIGFLRTRLRQAAASGAKIDLLMIGPLTNLALALRLEPSIAGGIGRLTIMGGTLHGRGNTTPAAEFNIYADPEAAGIVFASPIDILLVPWETCAGARVEGAAMDALFAPLGPAPLKDFAEALARHSRRTVVHYTGADAFRFVDPLAAAAVIDPAIVTATLGASVDVALAPGIARGMTIVDPSGRLGTPRICIVEAVNLRRVFELYAQAVAAPARTNAPHA